MANELDELSGPVNGAGRDVAPGGIPLRRSMATFCA